MSTDRLFPIGGASDRGTKATGASNTDSAEFRRLLEQLERLSTKPSEGTVKGAEELQDAMRKAEDDFVAAMDLRRRLEEAFRKSQS